MPPLTFNNIITKEDQLMVVMARAGIALGTQNATSWLDGQFVTASERVAA